MTGSTIAPAISASCTPSRARAAFRAGAVATTSGVALGHTQANLMVSIQDGDVPVFWACGVTSQAAVMHAAPPFAITHEPGHMFVTDARDTDYRVA